MAGVLGRSLADMTVWTSVATRRISPACTECGTQETWLIGLNWLLTDYTALKFNVTQSHIGGGNGGFAPGSGFNENNGADITGFGMRAQVDW